MELIFLDTETTGIDFSKDRLCQVCYRTSKGTKMEYFKPSQPMSVKAMSVTHITNKMLADKPPFIGSPMHRELEALLAAGGVLVAHNAKFDCAMLAAEGLSVPQSICTLRVARFLDSKGIIPEYNLQFLRYYLDLEVSGSAHDAEGDVNVLHAVFQRLLAKVREQIPDEQAALQKMIEVSSAPSLLGRFNFGKYKDKTVEEVSRIDKGYLTWLLNQKLSSDDKDEDWIHTLQHHLSA